MIGASKLEEFDLSRYTDQYVTKLKKVIDAKVLGQEVVQAPDHEEPKILNLMDALKKSVAEAQAKLVTGDGDGEGADADVDEVAEAATPKKLAPSAGKKKRSRKVGN